MLTSIRIQNFRSIRDAQVKLGQVNLFIGPNNSGKSNFLKGIEILSQSINGPLDDIERQFKDLLPRESSGRPEKERIAFQIQNLDRDPQTFSRIIGYQKGNYDRHAGHLYEFNTESMTLNDTNPVHKFSEFLPEFLDFEEYDPEIHALSNIENEVRQFLSNLKLYKLEPNSFELSTELSNQINLEANGRNICSFLYTLSQNQEKEFTKLKQEFAECVSTLTSFSVPPDPDKKGNLRLKFFDSRVNAYWADEVSDGVLYFLALLCIVHQPNPPKLLLLEEPEKGIHPRRIKEVMNFIFELARLRGIQIILTSHSPYVVDHFADIPECISVFDRKDGETVIHNAADIIAEANSKLEAAGEEPIHYTDALGEYWVSGFLGGVPEVITGA
jgi:predicted ATPase